LRPLAKLTSLQSLNLTGCEQLSDLSPLAALTSLQSLNLSGCEQLSGDLSPLSGLTSLQYLNLSNCLGKFAPFESLLPTLQELRLFGCKLDDLPPEIYGERENENVLDKVRAHYADLQYDPRQDTALKVFLLGNGGVGKTQLCRRLLNLEFDPSVPTTHGVQLGETTLDLGALPNRCASICGTSAARISITARTRSSFMDMPSFSYSGPLSWNAKPPTRKTHSLCVIALYPTGSIISAPLREQMLPC